MDLTVMKTLKTPVKTQKSSRFRSELPLPMVKGKLSILIQGTSLCRFFATLQTKKTLSNPYKRSKSRLSIRVKKRRSDNAEKYLLPLFILVHTCKIDLL